MTLLKCIWRSMDFSHTETMCSSPGDDRSRFILFGGVFHLSSGA